jgi:uncharacterized membrane protein
MASQKRNRPASGQAKSGGTATRSGSGNSSSRGGNRTPRPSAEARAAKPGQAGRGQSGRAQNGRPAQGRPNGTPTRAGTLTAEPAGARAADAPFGAPSWLRWATLALSVAGLGVSIYLTIAHYTSPNLLVCSSSGVIDCTKVTTSAESVVFGVFPVAVLGLAFYVFMVAVNTPWAWRARLPIIWWARLGSAVVGIGFVLYLIYAEVIEIGNICLWCTSVHVITFLLFVLLVFAASLSTGTTAKPR